LMLSMTRAYAFAVLAVAASIAMFYSPNLYQDLGGSRGKQGLSLLQVPNSSKDGAKVIKISEMNIEDDDNDLNDDFDNNDDLLDSKPKKHLGGMANVMKAVVVDVVNPVAAKLTALEAKLAKLAEGPDIVQVLKPLGNKLEKVAEAAEDRTSGLKKELLGVGSGIENAADELQEAVKDKATSKAVDVVSTKVSAAVEGVSKHSEGALKTAKKNQKYLKHIYKSLHHHWSLLQEASTQPMKFPQVPQPTTTHDIKMSAPQPTDFGMNIEDNDNDNLNFDNNDDLLDSKPKKHLGGMAHVMATTVAEVMGPVAAQLKTLEAKLAILASRPALQQAITPLGNKLEAVAQADEDGSSALKKVVHGVGSSIQDAADKLKETVADTATSEEVGDLGTKVSAAVGVVSKHSHATSKTVEKNQKYLKRIYKDLHHR